MLGLVHLCGHPGFGVVRAGGLSFGIRKRPTCPLRWRRMTALRKPEGGEPTVLSVRTVHESRLWVRCPNLAVGGWCGP